MTAPMPKSVIRQRPRESRRLRQGVKVRDDFQKFGEDLQGFRQPSVIGQAAEAVDFLGQVPARDVLEHQPRRLAV
jgi:hypothetical protein